jgi:hypothetical protein
VQLPNLEKPGEAVKEAKVPKGTVLLSKGKPVTSSDAAPTIGELKFITDGENAGDDGYYVELGPGVQWVQIDLGASHPISLITVWHYHKAARAYKDMVIQTSDDPDFTTATTIFNSDLNNNAGKGVGSDPTYIETNHGRLIKAKGAKGRYVRLYSNGNTADDLNHYIEVEVYGLPNAG